MTNEEILESAGMRLKDQQTGQEGYTLAAALLFGKEKTLTSVVPFYKTDAICRKDESRLYDDRDIVKCNLLRSFQRLMDFCGRHLPEWPIIEGEQRKSIRELIFREVCLNLLIHREFGAHHDASLIIGRDKVETRNWNIPFGYGQITLGNLRPHAKNPTIANFFAQLGIVEELGNGTRTMFKYVPLISGGQEPLLEEQDEFKVCIPYVGVDSSNASQVPSVNGQQTDSKRTANGQQTLTADQQKVLQLLEEGEKSILELMAVCGYKKRESFRNSVLNDLIDRNIVAMTHPENISHRNQRYIKVDSL